MPVIVIPEAVAERLRREAERLGVSPEEYLLELISQGLDPKSKAVEFVEVATDLLERAREELRRGSVRQAAEKVWGAAALAVRAHAYWGEGRRLASHRELWEHSLVITKEFGEWVRESWFAAVSMHTCFYEGWCEGEHVEGALKAVRRLVEAVAEEVARQKGGQP